MVWKHEAAPNDKIIFKQLSVIPDVVDIEGCSCESKRCNVTIEQGLTQR
jgi:hypothetical protein